VSPEETHPDPPTDSGTPRPAPRRVAVCCAVAALMLVGAYASNLGDLVRTWFNEPDYSHGFFVIPVALAVARRRTRGMTATDLAPSAWGLALLAAVLAARAAFFERGDFWFETATLLPAAAAVTLACGGWGLLRRAWPAIAFLVFMLPIPPSIGTVLSQPLQRVAATASGWLLRLSGLWVLNEGNVLDLGGEKLEVATACNGLAMLMSLAATVAAIVLLVPMGRGKRIALMAAALPLALLCNVLRIAATAVCYKAFGSETGRHLAHDVAGWLMMPLALALIGLGLAWSSWLVQTREATPESRLAPAVAGLAPIR
jgi:exosortase